MKRWVGWCLVVWLLPLLVACWGGSSLASDPQVAAAPVATTVPLLDVAMITPLDEGQALAPIQVSAPARNFVATVAPMGWSVTEVAGKRRAVWDVPHVGAGWHLNSAKAGADGNVVISGHHLLGAAVFAPVSRRELGVGEELLLTDREGVTFVYQVTEVTDPIPALEPTPEDAARVAAYLAADGPARLTLMTGWPDFTDTHYLFVIAEFRGVLP